MSNIDLRRRRTRRLRRQDMLQGTIVLSLAIVLSLFLADGGVSYFTSFADAVTGAGIIAGLIGSNLLLVMLLLIARVPLIEKTFGQQLLIATHQKLGQPTFYFLVCHMALLLWGYALAEGQGILEEALVLLSAIPDIVLATISIGLITVVILTSLVIVRKKLAYEFWYIIHLLTYLAVLIAIPHQFSTGQLFAPGTWASGYWITLWILALGLIAIYRIILPVIQNLRHRFIVTGTIQEADDVYSIIIAGRDLKKLDILGGQYFILRFWSRTGWFHSHPFSISHLPINDELRVTIKQLGAGTRKLSQVPVGTRVSFQGPFGVFVEKTRSNRNIVLIGAGIGSTAIRGLLEDPNIGAGEATVILRARSHSQMYLGPEIHQLCQEKFSQLILISGRRPTHSSSWLSQDALNKGENFLTLAPEMLSSDLYICGRKEWIDLVVQDAINLGLPRENIHTDGFAY